MSNWRTNISLFSLCLITVPAIAKDLPQNFDPSKYSQTVTECDRLAAHSEDPNKVAAGVAEAKVDLPAAIAACRIDLAKDAGNPRLQYQLGRALSYAGQIDEALPLLESSSRLAYPQAQFVLGYLLLDGRLKAPVDRCGALEWFRQSARQQRMAAQIGLAAWYLDGHFAKCPNRPTRAELLGNLAAARAQNPKFYPELLISDLERQLGARQRVK
ncbi:MAG: sel1 repeat family protein [Sinobacteraceae bacterium]|nr:sel1 repeat family protein [Nevskiaceae bacterium]MCP5339237.1 sel1 repeat family protein [Nevskiaceae bacterium]MCP5359414.1 sel1 repeat family protein [Nevskiaceae bacterium]MCP5467315.1 sel1 repeat family protein [Nevskiaceae bacterium]MCP5470853.1 sel1 repeat family protein [Nevskiaceae bacterium]